MQKLLAIVVMAILAACVVAGQGRSGSGACDRACLEGIVNQYLNAMVAHDASKAPMAKNVKFTENVAKLPFTAGLWYTSTGLGDYPAGMRHGRAEWQSPGQTRRAAAANAR